MSGKQAKIASELIQSKVDYRAEVLSGEIIDKGIKPADVSIRRVGGFRRRFDRDLQSVTNASDDPVGDEIVLNVNREGLYDFLPEELFHFETNLKQKNEITFTKKHQIKVEQEANARSFFAPVESEFSSLLIALEQKEKNSADRSFGEELISDFFDPGQQRRNFANLQNAKLNYFMPLSYKLRGKVEFIEFILTSLLNKKLKCVIDNMLTVAKFPDGEKLGNSILGVNSILGSEIEIRQKCCNLHFFELDRLETVDFMPGGKVLSVIRQVLDFFLPNMFDFEIFANYKESESYFSLGDQENPSFAGYNCILL